MHEGGGFDTPEGVPTEGESAPGGDQTKKQATTAHDDDDGGDDDDAC